VTDCPVTTTKYAFLARHRQHCLGGEFLLQYANTH
jgi:hypothetical protein